MKRKELFRTLFEHLKSAGVESYQAWKIGALRRLQAHFEEEAEDSDSGRAFFGSNVRKGLALFDLLARRYDIVAANPPYMGTKNMGAMVKSFVERNYTAGKRDLYAAFILRCRELAMPGGRVAMVAQQSWMFLRSYADLRAMDVNKIPRLREGSFPGLLRTVAFETIAHLGEHAFSDSSAAGAFAAMFVVRNAMPDSEHCMAAFRLIGPKSPEEKNAMLRDALDHKVKRAVAIQSHRIRSRVFQNRFLDIPQSPLCYWLGERFFQLLESVPDAPKLRTSEGLGTRNDPRFLRFVWEVSNFSRWWRYSKGGGYAKWTGNDWWTVEWANNGARVKSYIRQHYPPEKFTLLVRHETCWPNTKLVYSTAGRGSLGVRSIFPIIPGDAGPAIFADPVNELAASAFLNARPASYLIRALIAGGINLKGFYVSLLPLHACDVAQSQFRGIAESCIELKKHITGTNLVERGFCETADLKSLLSFAVALHTVEGFNEQFALSVSTPIDIFVTPLLLQNTDK